MINKMLLAVSLLALMSTAFADVTINSVVINYTTNKITITGQGFCGKSTAWLCTMFITQGKSGFCAG